MKKIALVVFMSLLIVFVFNLQGIGASDQASIQDVLRGEAVAANSGSSSAAALGIFLASLVAVSFATVMIRRNLTRLPDPLDEETQNSSLELQDIRRENNRVLLENEKLVEESEYLKKEKSLLASKLFNYKETIETLMSVESDLKRGNLAMQKEIDRLRSEKERPARKKARVKASARKVKKGASKKRK